jgi:hypothetical protein
LVVEIRDRREKAGSEQPNAPPTSANSSDSIRNASNIATRGNPSAHSVPISAVRVATAEGEKKPPRAYAPRRLELTD